MKTEETERQRHLRRWSTIVLILFILIGTYLFVGPFIIVWGNGSRTFLDWVMGGPDWLGNCWSTLNRSFFILQFEIEIYGRYLRWVVEVVGA